MSKLITVSVYYPFLTENGRIEYRCQKLSMQQNQSLYEALVLQAGFILRGGQPRFYGCNRGICGKCKVRFREGAPLPTAADRRFFTPEELRTGYRLACQCRLVKDAKIEICFEKNRDVTVVMEKAATEQEIEVPERNQIPEEELGFLVDIGTTTVAMRLISMKAGTTFMEYAALNPQQVFGADVMARLSEAKEHTGFLQESIVECILKGLYEVTEHIKKETGWTIEKHKIPIYVAGNTTMLHLLFGFPTDELSVYPFVPYTLEEQKMMLRGYQWNALPGFSAFVGADLYADLCALPMDGTFLLLDLGTNAEMVLYDGHQYFMTAAAAGTAFEGGKDGTLFGAEMIHETTELLSKGVLDETGLLAEPYFTNGVKTNHGIITTKDIRELQKAKAAVSAGIDILLAKAGLSYEDVDRIYLCGGFGHFLNPGDAIFIGMFPKAFEGKIESLGNMVLEGIYRYYSCEEKRIQIQTVSEQKVVVNLAEECDFEEKYIKAMNFKNRPE